MLKIKHCSQTIHTASQYYTHYHQSSVIRDHISSVSVYANTLALPEQK